MVLIVSWTIPRRKHPLVRTHPVTSWKALFVNRSMTRRIDGLDKRESDIILEHLFDVYERNVCYQSAERIVDAHPRSSSC
jgi:alpha-ketoglutarate-dependent taurine dioxygenase